MVPRWFRSPSRSDVREAVDEESSRACFPPSARRGWSRSTSCGASDSSGGRRVDDLADP